MMMMTTKTDLGRVEFVLQRGQEGRQHRGGDVLAQNEIGIEAFAGAFGLATLVDDRLHLSLLVDLAEQLVRVDLRRKRKRR